MTDLTLENLQVALQPIHNGLAALTSRMDGLASEMATVKSELSDLRIRVDGLAAEMATVKSELGDVRIRVDGLAAEMANVRVRVDGLPLLGVAVETLRVDLRMTRAAINDMARINISAGEVEAMHTDIDRTMARQDAIETRLATLERLAGQTLE
jgi:chromosome segregation ATPase